MRYVDPNLCRDGIPDYSVANRSCGGSDGVGYKTVAGAIAAATAGETITLRGGTHTGKYSYGATPRREAAFYLNKSVTLQAFTGETPVLTFTPGDPPIQDASDFGPIVLVTVPGVVLHGLSVVGTRALGDSPGGGDTDVSVRAQNGASVWLDGCIITDFGHCGLKADTAGGTVRMTGGRISDGGFTGRDHCVYVSAPFTAGASNICLGNTREAFGSGLAAPSDPQSWPDCGTDTII